MVRSIGIDSLADTKAMFFIVSIYTTSCFVFLSLEDAANTRWFRLICIVSLCRSKENILTFVASLAASLLGIQETIEKVDGSYKSDIFTKAKLFLYV